MRAVGYKILLPASATPGRPTQAPLPVDPAWKSDYAASIKRLICDGVDMPLPPLFSLTKTKPLSLYSPLQTPLQSIPPFDFPYGSLLLPLGPPPPPLCRRDQHH